MRNLKWLLLALAAPVMIIGCKKEQVQQEADQPAETQQTIGLANARNGAPSGAHYTLNIIGVAKDKIADMTGTQGHSIFVKLDGVSKILLAEGDTYEVTDRNGTDANGAAFTLPNPDPDNNGITDYSVWARALGKPGGSSTMVTCATEVATGDVYCSEEELVSVRDKGGSTFTNVSKQLLYIYADLDGDGTAERYNLFHDDLQDYYWEYTNNGLRLLQLRFYEIATNVN